MKKRHSLFVYFLFLLFWGYSQFGNASTLKGTIHPAPETKKIYLFLYQGDMLKKVDSTSHKSGKYSFKSDGDGFPRGLYKVGPGPLFGSNIILSKEDVILDCENKKWEEAKILGSKENESYIKFRDLNRRMNFEMQVLESKYKFLLPKAQIDKVAFESGLQQLRSKADSLLKDQQLKYLDWLGGDKSLFFNKMLRLSSSDPAVSPETYITIEDFEDLENLRADVWTTRISNLLQKFGQQDADKWIILTDQVIKLTRPATLAREIALRSVAISLRPLEQSGLNAAYDVAKRYTEEYPGPVSALFIKDFTPGPPAVGEMAPDIELADVNGNLKKLSSLKGKVVLLDFWASWCGPCRMENPNVVKAYREFESKGFTVFSVSLDQNKDKWLGAISKDGLVWEHHVSDLKGWQSAGSALYKVTGIPATFLLDKTGKITAKNLRGKALDDKLKELLGP